MKKALITGVAGQDGSYLAEFLLEKGYEVFGVEKSWSSLPLHIHKRIECCLDIDITKPNSLKNIIREITPDEIYHSIDLFLFSSF